MTEKRTFDKLRQIPLEEMRTKLENMPRMPPMFPGAGMIGSSGVLHRADYYSEINYYHERIRLLKENGWEFEEFGMALEKQAVLDMIRDFNDTVQFPQEILDRAKRFFPNAKYTPAGIELND